MKARYIGDPSQPREGVPETFEAFGVTFTKGKFSDVPDSVAAKFRGNSHYETSAAGDSKPAPAPVIVPGASEQQVPIPENWAELHWTQRVKLAKELGAVDDVDADGASEFITAEAARRVGPVSIDANQA